MHPGKPFLGCVATLVAAAFFAGCSSRALSPESPTVTVRGIDETGWVELRQKHRGRVLLVNFWATWCEPCREEFPGLVRLDHVYRARGLTVVGISMDAPTALPAVQRYLQLQGAAFPSYLYDFRDFATLVGRINPRWTGDIPATFIYDRDGRLVESWEGATSFEDFERVVRPLLN